MTTAQVSLTAVCVYEEEEQSRWGLCFLCVETRVVWARAIWRQISHQSVKTTVLRRLHVDFLWEHAQSSTHTSFLFSGLQGEQRFEDGGGGGGYCVWN